MDVLLNICSQLGIDQSLFTQFAIVLVGMPLIATLLVKPLFHAFEKREELTAGARKRLEALGRESQEAAVAYQKKIGDAHHRAKNKLDHEVSRGEEEAKTIMKLGQDTAMRMLEKMRQSSRSEVEELRTKLSGEVEVIVKEIVGKLT